MVEVRLLGAVEVRGGGTLVRLRGPKQRALLAMLVLQDNGVVSRDRLIDGIWGPVAPPGVEHALDAQVSALRQSLVAAGGPAIERCSPGYRLVLDQCAVDVRRFDQLVDRGRRLVAAGDPVGAAAILDEALDLWHGPALADVEAAPFAAAQAEELERRHVDALEERIDADLARGGGPELVGELEGLVREHPFRERAIADLALALYRSGQQARALEVIASARRAFASELGLQPGAALLGLERRILNQDPDLLPSVPPAPVVAQRRPRSAAPRRHRWVILTVATVLIAAMVAFRGLHDARHDASASEPGGQGDLLTTAALAGVDLETGRTSPLLALTSTPSAVVADGAGIWASEPSDNKVELIDPEDGSVLADVPVSGGPGALTVGDGAVFVAQTLAGAVVRIDEESKRDTQTISVGGVPSALAYADHRLWVADQNGRRVLSIDPDTGEIEHSASLPDRPTALVADTSGVWVASHEAHTVTLIDPDSTTVVSTADVGGGPSALALGGGSLWVANNDDATVSRVEPSDARVVATVPVNSGPAALTYADGALWVAGQHAGTLARVDPSSNAMTRQLPIQGSPVALTERQGQVWMGAAPSAELRGGTMTLLASFGPRTVDPGFQDQFLPPTLLGLVHDGLVTFDHTSGPAGLQLVPDLAVALETPSASATTFRFQLRPGITYSDGRPVRAADFRRAFRRLLEGGSPGATYFQGIVGARGCTPDADSCGLRHGVVVDNALGTVTFHLTSPDPDFLSRLALTYGSPVPPGTPMHDTGMAGIPGTGPYTIVHADAHEIRLVRNPTFHEWSYAAQPDGSPDSIVWRFGLSPRAQVNAVRAGEADWLFQGIPANMLTEVRNHDLTQLHINDEPQTDYLFFKTSVPPFDHVLARRALNLAIDRGRIASAYGGPEAATPTCQMLPPGETARVPYCPYTRDPSPDGRWLAPDMDRARRLVARSGTTGMTVTVLENTDDPPPSHVASRAAASALTRLGYQVRLRFLSHEEYNRLSPAQQVSFDVYPYSWYADFPSPSTFFQSLLPYRPIPGHQGSYAQALSKSIHRALDLEAQGRGNHVALWSAIDRRATRQAFTVPLANPRTVELTSARLRGYEYNPLWGFLPAQATIAN